MINFIIKINHGNYSKILDSLYFNFKLFNIWNGIMANFIYKDYPWKLPKIFSLFLFLF